VQFASQGCPGERIQSLANRHHLVYTIRTSNLDLEPALGGWLTASRKELAFSLSSGNAEKGQQ
jgi:hypothetical protein